jgi:hypothetical protein
MLMLHRAPSAEEFLSQLSAEGKWRADATLPHLPAFKVKAVCERVVVNFSTRKCAQEAALQVSKSASSPHCHVPPAASKSDSDMNAAPTIWNFSSLMKRHYYRGQWTLDDRVIPEAAKIVEDVEVHAHPRPFTHSIDSDYV